MAMRKKKQIFMRTLQILCIAGLSFIVILFLLLLLDIGTAKGYDGPIATYEDTLLYQKDSMIYEYRPQTGSQELINDVDGDFCLLDNTLLYVKKNQLLSLSLSNRETSVIYECEKDTSMSVHGPKDDIILVYLQSKDGMNEKVYLNNGSLTFESFAGSDLLSSEEQDWETLNRQYGDSIYVYDKWGNTDPTVQSIADSFLTISYARQAGDYLYIVVPYKNSDNLYCYYPMYNSNGIAYGLEEVDILLPRNALSHVEGVVSALSFTTNALLSILLEVAVLIVLLTVSSKQINKYKIQEETLQQKSLLQ